MKTKIKMGDAEKKKLKQIVGEVRSERTVCIRLHSCPRTIKGALIFVCFSCFNNFSFFCPIQGHMDFAQHSTEKVAVGIAHFLGCREIGTIQS